MKKRFLLILAFGISFTPAVFADGLGQQDRSSQIGGPAITCEHARQDKELRSSESGHSQDKGKPESALAD